MSKIHNAKTNIYFYYLGYKHIVTGVSAAGHLESKN